MKLADVEFLVKDIQREMPVVTDRFMKIKTGYVKPPKNLQDVLERIDNKFLNNYEHKIEELEYKFPKNNISLQFAKYQLGRFSKFGILNHDGFFNKLRNTVLYGHKDSILGCGMILGNMNTGAYRGSDPNGIELQTTSTETAFGGSNNAGYIFASQTPATGTIGKLYDRIAIHTNITQSCYVACYDSTPSDRLAVTGSVSYTADDYILQSVTEFAITETSVWISAVGNSNSSNPYKGDDTTTSKLLVKNTTYTSPSDPFPASPSTGNPTVQGKTNHS